MHCKGYVARNNGKCHIATTSKCTSFEGCRQYNSGYVGALDVDARCGSRRRRDRYNGCYIKERSNLPVFSKVPKKILKDCNSDIDIRYNVLF